MSKDPGPHSRIPRPCAACRKMALSVPWSERGDFVHEAISQWAERTGKTRSTVMFEALEWYFTNKTPIEFYNKINTDIESAEYARLHKPGEYTLCNRMGCTTCYSKRNQILANREDASRAGSG